MLACIFVCWAPAPPWVWPGAPEPSEASVTTRGANRRSRVGVGQVAGEQYGARGRGVSLVLVAVLHLVANCNT